MTDSMRPYWHLLQLASASTGRDFVNRLQSATDDEVAAAFNDARQVAAMLQREWLRRRPLPLCPPCLVDTPAAKRRARLTQDECPRCTPDANCGHDFDDGADVAMPLRRPDGRYILTDDLDDLF